MQAPIPGASHEPRFMNHFSDLISYEESQNLMSSRLAKHRGDSEAQEMLLISVRTLFRAEYERKWQNLAEIGFSPFWPHWFACGWASRGCVHSCCCACCVRFCLRSVLSMRMHMHLVMIVIVPKCFCLFVQRSVECLLGSEEDAKVPDGTMGKKTWKGAAECLQISWDSVRHVPINVSKQTQVGLTRNQDRMSTQSSIS